MDAIFKAVVLGVVEGITEFLPISSTGHLILVGHWMGFNGEKAARFDVFIQLGAILAVVLLFRERWTKLFVATPQRGFGGVRGWLLLGVGTLPAIIAGGLFHSIITGYLFHPLFVSVGLLAGGLAILAIENRGVKSSVESLDGLTWRMALGVGLFQCLALWPGVSRSAATIMGGLLLGLNRKTAAEFSFLLAVPVMVLAVAYDLFQCARALALHDILFFATGFVVAFVAAWVTVAWLIRYVSRHSFSVFGLYRVILALIVLAILH